MKKGEENEEHFKLSLNEIIKGNPKKKKIKKIKYENNKKY